MNVMKENPLLELESFGQSIWLDLIHRAMLSENGELEQLVKNDGLSGVTSNPAIFEKAIVETPDYDAAIRSLVLEDKKFNEISEIIMIEDIQRAADILRHSYEETDGRDGFVSLEVSPHLAHETLETIVEGRRLWKLVDRPNVLIKVPATREGVPAIQQLIKEGINVNVTLLFSLKRYKEVIDAYIGGIKARLETGLSVNQVSSVASFFLSRIDVLADSLLNRLDKKIDADDIEAEGEPPSQRDFQVIDERTKILSSLLGQVAIASAKLAYQKYKEIFKGAEFQILEMKGARSQRLLWASTSPKNPCYSDVKYVEPLIGPETINTVPLETLNAYRDHGKPAPRIEEDIEKSFQVLKKLKDLEIDLDAITTQLEAEGVDKFVKPYDKMLEAIELKRKEILKKEAHTKRPRAPAEKSL